jgi:hypothetical protein
VDIAQGIKDEPGGIAGRGLSASEPIRAGGHILEWDRVKALPDLGFAGDFVLAAMRDVEPGEELTTDDALSDTPDTTMACTRSTTRCRLTSTGDDWRDPVLREHYVPAARSRSRCRQVLRYLERPGRSWPGRGWGVPQAVGAVPGGGGTASERFDGCLVSG